MENPENRFNICDKRLAILEGSGHMLVLGGPGSGKTTIALLKARRDVLERLRPEQSVLFLSFSNAAIRRILESAGNILSNDIGRQVEIKTYHSFAWDILRSHGYLLSSQRKLAIVAAQDAAVLRGALKEDDWMAEEERLFTEDGRVTYDQFAPRAADLLQQSMVVRKCFGDAHPLIFVDEFQDTDEDQWRLIQVLSNNSEIIALGDTDQRIYSWRKGMSTTRLKDFAEILDATIYDFQNENNRSPATGIVGYARSLLSPEVQLDLPDDIEFKRFQPRHFALSLRFALLQTWKVVVEKAGHRDITIAVAARSRAMVRMISDALAVKFTFKKKEYKPVPHDVMFDHMQITLAARVIAFIMASKNKPINETLAGVLNRISAVFRSSATQTSIQTSDRLLKWVDKCRQGKPPKTKCVNTLTNILKMLYATGFSGSPTEDWLTVRHALEDADAHELKRTGDHSRYLRLLRRGSAIEAQLADLWKQNGNYAGAEAALDEAILQNQISDNYHETHGISVLTMHQMKGREYDAVLLVEDHHRTFRGRDNTPPYMETRRLLQVSLTRARFYAYILSATGKSTLDVIFED